MIVYALVNAQIEVKDAIYLPKRRELLLIFTAATDRGELTAIPEGYRLEIFVRTGSVASKPVAISHLSSLLAVTDTEEYRIVPPRKAGEPYEITLKGVKAEQTSKVSIALISPSGARVTEISAPITSVPVYA